jgi:error-prone DNA polymerase
LAERVFEQVRGFSGFGFPKSHSAAFGLLAYQSTWLRVHYGPELLCSLFNEQPMGFYPPDSLAHDAQRRGIEVLPAEVNASEVLCTVEPTNNCEPKVRIGLGYIKGLAAEEAETLVTERLEGGPYRDLADLASRSGMGRDGLERLAWAGACESIGLAKGSAPRREELWRLGVARGGQRIRGRAHAQLSLPLSLPAAPGLRPLDTWERIVADYSSTGVTLGEHPIEALRAELPDHYARSDDLRRLPDRSEVEIAGMVVARQRPATANGVVFMLLEDEAGAVNVIVPPPVYERCRLAVRTASFALLSGRLERREGVINVLAARVERLATPGPQPTEVRHIEPPAERETGRDQQPAELPAVAAGGGRAGGLAAVAPRPHSFGRRG